VTHGLVKKRGVPARLILGLMLATLACSLLPGISAKATPTHIPPAVTQSPPASLPATATGPANTPASQLQTPGAAAPTAAGPTDSTPTPAGVTSPATTTTAALQAQFTVTQAVTFGTGPFILADPKTGLSDLTSYSAKLMVAFDGTVNGQPAKWSRTYVMLVAKAPPARQLTIETSGDVSPTETVYLAELDEADYERHGQSGCSANAIQAGHTLSDRLEPAGFLHYVVGAADAGTDTVNSVAAEHYTFDERALGQQGLTQSSGELWVAAPGGYLVKYLLTSKGDAGYFGDGIAGTLTQDYELTGAGQPVSIQLPAGCPGGMLDAPLLPDASSVVKTPGLVTYMTATSPADAAAFYQKQLTDLGWALSNPADVSTTTAFIDFNKAGEELTVSVTTDAGVTTVNILVVRGQP